MRSLGGAARSIRVLIVAVAMLAAGSSQARAQSAEQLSAACIGAGGSAVLCPAAAVGVLATQSQIGLVAGMGSPIPGTATTTGTRIGGGPRLTVFGRASAVDMALPDIGDTSGRLERSAFVPAFHVGAVLGVFDGFRIMPTVGGLFSTDLIAQMSIARPPISEGFDGNVTAYSLGMRLGVLREGFSVPGISVSVARRFLSAYELIDPSISPLGSLEVDPAVTSVRATIGKDLFAVEVLGGVGWDDYSSDAQIRVIDGMGSAVSVSGDVSASRLLYFGSATMTFSIVLSVTVEAGWARGFDPVAGYSGQYDVSGSVPFGSLSLRLNL